MRKSFLAQVPSTLADSWRRCSLLLAQVVKKGGYLRHRGAYIAILRRRSPTKNLTCAKKGVYLRRERGGPAPGKGRNCSKKRICLRRGIALGTPARVVRTL